MPQSTNDKSSTYIYNQSVLEDITAQVDNTTLIAETLGEPRSRATTPVSPSIQRPPFPRRKWEMLELPGSRREDTNVHIGTSGFCGSSIGGPQFLGFAHWAAMNVL